jgi:cobalt-zinc-cadmium efflux system protein
LGAVVLLTLGIMLVEIVGGLQAHSLGLLADAGHMLTDLLALVLAWAAAKTAARPADARRTYGYRRLEILAALANGVALFLVSGWIAHEAWERWQTPSPVNTRVTLVVAVVGLLANGAGLWTLAKHRKNLNVRAAFLHMLGDTLSSVGVIAGAAIMGVTGYWRLDAVLSFGIALLIVVGSVRLLREVVDVLLESAPPEIDTRLVHKALVAVPGVVEVHDLHVWSIATGVPALSAHVILANDAHDRDRVLHEIQLRLHDCFAIHHSTVQIEGQAQKLCSNCTPAGT